VAASVLTGSIAAVVAVVVVFAGAPEPVIDGTALLGFAVGWALLLALSARFTDRPQRWAAVPAAAMAMSGAALLIFEPSNAVLDALGWVWPSALIALIVWMGIQVHRKLAGALARWFVSPVLVIMTVAAIGGGYHTVRQSLDRAAESAAPGQLFDVGDHRLYLSCTGSGEPTVIMEPGLGEDSAEWGWIAPAVADRTRVCVYDRPAAASANPARPPRTASRSPPTCTLFWTARTSPAR